ncbi:MAG: peptidylprolyl isomerase [Deltaproteobacteria bacterium]|nr:peptidylprolyl isomerase [Deltaproteobacteria bacterium]
MQKKQVKWFRAGIMLLALVLMPFQAVAENEQAVVENEPAVAGAVAVVNGSAVTQESLDSAMQWVKQNFVGPGRQFNASQMSEIEKEVLEKLINKELLYQESQRMGIVVEASEARDELIKIKRAFPGDVGFKNALGKMGIFGTNMESQIRRWMEIRRFVALEFVRNVKIPEAEIKAYYDNHTSVFWEPEQIRVSHILIKVNDETNEIQASEARSKIETIRQSLAAGEDFASLAMAHSQCPSTVNGGDLGYIRRGQMTRPFDSAAFALAPGEVSGIVETHLGYHLIKVFNSRPDSIIFFEDARERIARHLKSEEIQRQVNQYVEELKKDAEIERFL